MHFERQLYLPCFDCALHVSYYRLSGGSINISYLSRYVYSKLSNSLIANNIIL